MKFFKHFADAHRGKSLTSLMNEFGLEGYAAYFILMEMCAEKLKKEPEEGFTAEHCRFTFNERTLREKLRMRSTKVELFLNSCSTLVLLQFTRTEDEFNFYVPKLLECLDRDSRRARHDRVQAAPKIKSKEKESKSKRSPRSFQSVEDLLANLPQQTKESWEKLYPKDFRDRETVRAFEHHSHKKEMTMRGWCRAIGGWLERGLRWEKERRAKNPEFGGWDEQDGVGAFASQKSGGWEDQDGVS